MEGYTRNVTRQMCINLIYLFFYENWYRSFYTRVPFVREERKKRGNNYEKFLHNFIANKRSTCLCFGEFSFQFLFLCIVYRWRPTFAFSFLHVLISFVNSLEHEIIDASIFHIIGNFYSVAWSRFDVVFRENCQFFIRATFVTSRKIYSSRCFRTVCVCVDIFQVLWESSRWDFRRNTE